MMDFSLIKNCKIKENVSMSECVTFKTGGNAELMLIPENEDGIISALRFCAQIGKKPFIMGNGSNLLIADEGLDCPVIKLDKDFSGITLINGDTLRCQSGALLVSVCNTAKENSLTGLEFAYGIPGSVGGAVFMNAGAYDGEMKDVVTSVRAADLDGNIYTIPAADCDFSYRHSVFEDNGMVILSADIKLQKGNIEKITAKMNELMGRRRDKQPLEYPSAGSTFKRPGGGLYVGRLIEEAGLRGFSVGGAQVSEKHCGFIINKGGATTADILALIAHCRDTVEKSSGVKLEPEVRYICPSQTK